MAEDMKTVKKIVKRVKKAKKESPTYRDIGIDIEPPKETCSDPNCPFHGTLPVRGQIFEGRVKSSKMEGSVVVEVERLYYVKKYERYEKRFKRFSAHSPPCIHVEAGDMVKIMECRPISKTVSFVVVGVSQ